MAPPSMVIEGPSRPSPDRVEWRAIPARREDGVESERGPQRPILILGTGYTGHRIAALAMERGLAVLAGSRSPETRLRHLAPGCRVTFDLARPDTWAEVPERARVLWCFPAAPYEAVAAFAQAVGPRLSRLVVLGSTSAYDRGDGGRPSPDTWLDESSPINRALPRVQGEEYLRLTHGAVVLRVAGIYGPGRNPLDWIRAGRITDRNRSVNLIHVDDLADICLLALERAGSGEVYNASDGTPRRWGEICKVVQRRWGITPPPLRGGEDPGKRISNAKLRTELDYTFRYPDLYAALEELEKARSEEERGASHTPSGC